MWEENWWDEKGHARLLHLINPLRLSFIKATVLQSRTSPLIVHRPFEGLKVLDLGCGGGLLCEPLARLGAKVIGIDSSQSAVEQGKKRSLGLDLDIQYYCQDILSVDFKNDFDILIASEIIEHIEDKKNFIKKCSLSLKKNGFLFISTITKKPISYFYCIFMCEYILRWIPKGTHRWDLFINPQELEKVLRKNNLFLKEIKGIRFNILKKSFELNHNIYSNYILACQKENSC